MFEITVVVKGENEYSGDSQTLNRKFVCYEENVSLNHDDPYLLKIVQETVEDFNGNVDDTSLKIKMVW